jgi:chromosome segregation ATPase
MLLYKNSLEDTKLKCEIIQEEKNRLNSEKIEWKEETLASQKKERQCIEKINLKDDNIFELEKTISKLTNEYDSIKQEYDELTIKLKNNESQIVLKECEFNELNSKFKIFNRELGELRNINLNLKNNLEDIENHSHGLK